MGAGGMRFMWGCASGPMATLAFIGVLPRVAFIFLVLVVVALIVVALAKRLFKLALVVAGVALMVVLGLLLFGVLV